MSTRYTAKAADSQAWLNFRVEWLAVTAPTPNTKAA